MLVRPSVPKSRQGEHSGSEVLIQEQVSETGIKNEIGDTLGKPGGPVSSRLEPEACAVR